MCAVLSVLTLKPQHADDPTAAHRLAHRLQGSFNQGDHVLIVVRSHAGDQAFAAALDKELRASQLDSTVVIGTPRDARAALEQIAGEKKRLAAIIGNSVTASWLVLSNVEQSFPQLGPVPVIHPQPYSWPTFLKTDNLLNVANQIAVIAIIAVGMTFVIIAGGIDLSVGSLIALASVIAAMVIRANGGTDASLTILLFASLLGILACGLIGAFSGSMVIGLDIPPFIITLAMMMVGRGTAFLLAKGNSIPELPQQYTWLGREASLLGIPNAVVLMAATYALAHFLLSSTVLGRHIYAVGDNRQAAWLSGIPVKRVLLFTYVASGLLAGVGGIVVASDFQSGDPRYGNMYELYVIAAVVVGGTSLSGGRGTVIGTLIGAFIIGVINNGMNLLQVNSYAQQVILGFVILGAVMLDKFKRTA
jgi:ribose transport system permease protein